MFSYIIILKQFLDFILPVSSLKCLGYWEFYFIGKGKILSNFKIPFKKRQKGSPSGNDIGWLYIIFLKKES
jgi:hypothetical protein